MTLCEDILQDVLSLALVVHIVLDLFHCVLHGSLGLIVSVSAVLTDLKLGCRGITSDLQVSFRILAAKVIQQQLLRHRLITAWHSPDGAVIGDFLPHSHSLAMRHGKLNQVLANGLRKHGRNRPLITIRYLNYHVLVNTIVRIETGILVELIRLYHLMRFFVDLAELVLELALDHLF